MHHHMSYRIVSELYSAEDNDLERLPKKSLGLEVFCYLK